MIEVVVMIFFFDGILDNEIKVERYSSMYECQSRLEARSKRPIYKDMFCTTIKYQKK